MEAGKGSKEGKEARGEGQETGRDQVKTPLWAFLRQASDALCVTYSNLTLEVIPHYHIKVRSW